MGGILRCRRLFLVTVKVYELLKGGICIRRLGRISCYVYASIELESAEIRWFHTGTSSYWAGAGITDWGGG